MTNKDIQQLINQYLEGIFPTGKRGGFVVYLQNE